MAAQATPSTRRRTRQNVATTKARRLPRLSLGRGVAAARRSARGHWSATRTFGPPNGVIEQSGSIQVAVAGNDQALVVWSAEIGGHFAARYRNGRFGTPSKLKQKGTRFRALGGTVSPDGSALVAGSTLGGSGYRWQRGPRRDWRTVREVSAEGAVYSVAGRGRRTSRSTRRASAGATAGSFVSAAGWSSRIWAR